MRIKHHLDSATLMSFAAGTLDETLAAVVAAHLDWCPHCRARARELDMLGGALLERVGGEALSEKAHERAGRAFAAEAKVHMLPRARAQRASEPVVIDRRLPGPLAHRLGTPLEGVRWRRLGPGIQYHRVPLSGTASGELRLLKIAPGRKLPEHGHSGSELTLVLTGAYSDASGRYGPGDVEDVDEECEHQPIVEPGEDCICLVAYEAPARFKGLISRVLQPLTGM